MPPSMRLPQLHVEGKDDRYAIGDLLKKHGLECDPKIGPVIIHDHGSEEGAGRGVEAMLRNFEFTVQQSADSCVGFIIDADSPFSRRWAEVQSRLQRLGGHPPPRINLLHARA